MYSFEEFVTQVKCGLERELTDRYGSVEISIVTSRKVNCEMVGLACSIENNKRVQPTIYMESLYRQYLEHGDMEEIIERAADTIVEAMQECQYVRSKINDFEDAENGIIFQLVHTEQNKELLNTMPHRKFMDMSIVYRCILDISDDGILSAPVTQSFADMLGLDEEGLYQLAFENTQSLLKPSIRTIMEVIEELTENSNMREELLMEKGAEEHGSLYVITNPHKTWGAASIIYREQLKNFAEKLESDLYLIPSSTHEMVITESDQNMLETVATTLYEVNQSIPYEDRLSNEIYLYDRKTNSITQVTDSPYKMLVEEESQGMEMRMC